MPRYGMKTITLYKQRNSRVGDINNPALSFFCSCGAFLLFILFISLCIAWIF